MKAIEQNIEKEIAQAVMEEQPMQPPAPKRKKRLTESTAAKVIAFLLMLVMTAVTAGGVLGAVFLYSTDVYVTSETAFKQELFSNIAWGDGQTLLNFLIWNSEEQVYQMNTEAADSYCAERNISYVMVQDKTGRELWYTGLAEYDSPWQFRFSYDWANPERPSAGVVENAYTVRITVPLSSVFVYDDDYALANRLAELAYALRYWIYAIIAAAALLVTVCFIFLLCAAGHHPYVDGVRPGWGTRIPLDLLTAAVALGLFLGIQLVVEANFGGIGVVLAVVLGPAALAGVFTGWCMSLALRLKLGGWWRNTVVYVALRLLRRGGGAVLRTLGSGLRAAAHGLAGLLHNVPLVGKTELVKQLAHDLFNTPESLIRLDMSEFMEKHAVSRIIGSPPGYVGYDEAGQLTEKIRRKPYSVILFDEIEKAHPDVLNILLQILDDGRITDAHGRTVNFENTVIVMTSNAGSNTKSGSVGFARTANEQGRERAMKALQEFLRPEFINRVDEIVYFNQLTEDNFKAIAALMLQELQDSLAEKGIVFTWQDSLLDYLVKKSYSAAYGARNLRRLIQKELEDAIASRIIDSWQHPVARLDASSDGEQLVLSAL